MKALDELAARIGRSYEPGTPIFRQGEPGDTMYIVHRGRVEVAREQGGARAVLATLGPGEFFGEMALVDQGPRSATVTAAEPCVVVPVTRDFLLKHSRKDSKFLFQVLEGLCRRLESTNRMIRQRFAGRPEPVVALVGKHEYVEPRSAAFLKSIARTVDARSYRRHAAGETVFQGGTAADVMFIILEGRVQIVQEESGKRYVLVELGRGSFFGELALITGESRTASAVASADVTLLPVDREAFLGLIREDPEVALHVIQILILRLRRSLRAVA